MMKNIAIFCDGTWQTLSQEYATNVVKLMKVVRPRTPDGVDQLVYYDNGVGVGEGVLNRGTKLLGGAFGQGLDHKIVEAYQFLCMNYEPGDRVFIFGFSRGAYTARSLAGLLRRVWVLKRENVQKIGTAMALYRAAPREDAPEPEKVKSAEEQREFNVKFGHPVEAVTGVRAHDREGLLVPDGAGSASIQYVGVWDTVGSMGIPSKLPFAPDFNKKHRFHSTDLSRFVRSARHAVAIDEQRETFTPALWTNIAQLNDNAGAWDIPYDERPYQQQWFPGVHGSVGGGSGDHALSAAALLWVAAGAARAGLALESTRINEAVALCNPLAEFDKPRKDLGGMIMAAVGKAPRETPDHLDAISLSACRRWHGLASYRPETLRGRAQDLEGWAAPSAASFYMS